MHMISSDEGRRECGIDPLRVVKRVCCVAELRPQSACVLYAYIERPQCTNNSDTKQGHKPGPPTQKTFAAPHSLALLPYFPWLSPPPAPKITQSLSLPSVSPSPLCIREGAELAGDGDALLRRRLHTPHHLGLHAQALRDVDDARRQLGRHVQLHAVAHVEHLQGQGSRGGKAVSMLKGEKAPG